MNMFRAACSVFNLYNRTFYIPSLQKRFGDNIERFYGTHNIHRSNVLHKFIYESKSKATANKHSLQSFHTTAYHSALPTWMVITSGQVPTFLAVAIGRFLRWQWSDYPLETNSERRELLAAKKNFFLALMLIVLSYAIGIYISGLQNDPLTSRRKFIGLNKKQIEELADTQFHDESPVFHMASLPRSDFRYKRLSRVLNRLIAANGDIDSVREKNWTLHIIDAPMYVNALAFHNGTVFVFSGTLTMCNTDDQLAFVLAHEIAHVLLLHMPELHSKVHFTDLLLILPFILIWTFLSFKTALLSHCILIYLSDLLVHFPFIRRLEYEADAVGLSLVAKACFDIREASVF